MNTGPEGSGPPAPPKSSAPLLFHPAPLNIHGRRESSGQLSTDHCPMKHFFRAVSRVRGFWETHAWHSRPLARFFPEGAEVRVQCPSMLRQLQQRMDGLCFSALKEGWASYGNISGCFLLGASEFHRHTTHSFSETCGVPLPLS